jgi:NAD(P)-dependent dehydrogenase (short-subunit alcohol dehydrogenase family)
VVSLIRQAGGKAVVNPASVADPAGATSIIDDALKSFGRIDGVVNNAGILRDRMFHRMSVLDWQQVIDVHLHGAFLVSKAAANYFKDQGSGAYVHFTSTSGLIGNFGQANYSAAKMGIVGLSNSIALDMQRVGVRSNCIAPFAWSRLIATIPAETEAEKQRVERLKSMSADKIAPLVTGLLSDAAKDVTGQIFCVRKNEIFLFSVPRPIRSLHRSEGWTPESIANEALPALRSSFHPLQRSADIFPYDAV